ncbi:MAG: TonB C-terminal domain-containing protein [Deltaproteobacteria bacterium]|nr:TonB C-terminal domain-containing protein [Deltaproteobacteria bacterium]
MARWDTRVPSFRGARWVVAVFLAILLQLPLLLGIDALLGTGRVLMDTNPLRHDAVAELETLPAEDLEEARDAFEEFRPEDRPEEIDGTEEPVGQIVDIAPPEREEMPERANYSARYASKVREEVRAREPTPDQSLPKAPVSPKRAATRERSAARGEQGRDRETETTPPETPSETPAAAADGSEPSERVAARPRRRDGGETLSPSSAGRDPFENVRSLGKPYASDDYLGQVGKTGDANLLNTMPFRYIGFFERIKEGVRREWSPNQVYQRRDPTGELFGYKDRMTVLKVVLDRNGYLEDTVVVRTSGLNFLDEEAKRAMWAASPFLNPPRALVKEDDKIRFEFGFVFLIASSRNSFFWKLQ